MNNQHPLSLRVGSGNPSLDQAVCAETAEPIRIEIFIPVSTPNRVLRAPYLRAVTAVQQVTDGDVAMDDRWLIVFNGRRPFVEWRASLSRPPSLQPDQENCGNDWEIVQG